MRPVGSDPDGRAALAFARFACALIVLASPVFAQESTSRGDGARKQAVATRTIAGNLHIDGRLNEDAWKMAQPITDFVQKEPVEGVKPTERMEVRFLFDDGALYVGARMHSRQPSAIQAPLGRRDEADAQSEYFLVSLDTYLDRRTAYTFGVTASGVRIDRFHRKDDEETASMDLGFDPVWEAKTHIDEEGWTAELWIPFSQLRFIDQPVQVWGLNMRRFDPALDEQDDWVLVPRTERAWASRFGELRGIARIPSMKRLELLPFVVGSSTVNGQREAANPFEDSRNFSGLAGLDAKMGLGPSLTLQATVNPDFGQVEADAAEVNLTTQTTRFPEKRPFFTESAQLLNISHNNFFYSRRIGGQPVGPATGDFVDYPSVNTILGAAKVTGRIRPGTSLGMLAAVTAEEFARVGDTARVADAARGTIRRIRVAPLTTFALARVEHEFAQLGSTASVMVAGVRRRMANGDPLAGLLSRDAFGYGGDLLLRFRGGEYQFTAAGGGTFVRGDTLAIARIQRSSAHYAQRPDRDYARFDPALASLSGFSLATTFDRVSGRHWLWGISPKVDSPHFETNDIGLLNSADGLELGTNVRYRETRPGRYFRNYALGVTTRNEWTWGGARQTANIVPVFNLTWRNFWTASLTTTVSRRTDNARLTRGGPLMRVPQGWKSMATVGNRSTSPTRWSGSVTVGEDENGGRQRLVNTSLSFHPAPRWQLAITPTFEHIVDTQQYVTSFGGGAAETFGRRYVFAAIERRKISGQFRMNYTLKPDVNLAVYAEPFAASGRYYDIGELSKPASLQRLTYGSAGTRLDRQPGGDLLVTTPGANFTLKNPDFNVRSYRSTIVLRWEWRPGSTLYLVAQQDRHATDPIGTPIGVGDVFRSLGATGKDVFLVKTSFWLPIR